MVREVEGRRVARVLVTVVPPPVVLSPEAADAAREAEPEIHTDQAS